MLDKVATWFETRYSPVALAGDRQPPMGIWKFFFYFLRPFRTAFILRVIIVAFGAVADAMLPIFVGLIVGMLADTQPGNLFSAHWQTFLVMALFVLLRPLTFAFDQLVRNQAIVQSGRLVLTSHYLLLTKLPKATTFPLLVWRRGVK